MKLKLGALMAKCPNITVENGWLQATTGSAIFREFVPKFATFNFAVNAKAFVDALKQVQNTCFIRLTTEHLLLITDKQEIKLVLVPPDIHVSPSATTAMWTIDDWASDWAIISEFVDPAYPGVRCCTDYLEAVSNESIVRMKKSVAFPQSVVIAACKLPKKSQNYAFINNVLWIGYNIDCYVGLTALDISLPNTDSFFKDDALPFKTIPKQLLKQLISADYAEFINGGILLKIADVTSAFIEGVEGRGIYDCSLFNKVVKHGTVWAMTGEVMHFESSILNGIIENKTNAED